MDRDIDEGPTLLFDGECRLCRTFARLASWWGLSSGLRVLPSQGEEARRMLPEWTDAQVMRSAHLVLPDGRVESDSYAFAALLDRLPVVGPVNRRVGQRFLVARLVRIAYAAAVVVRGALRCAVPLSGTIA